MFSSNTTSIDSLILILVSISECKHPFEKEIELDLKEFDSFNELFSIISKKVNVRLNQQKYEIKINYEDSWVNLIDIKSFYCFISCNLLLNKQTKLLIKQRIKDENEVNFNLKGEKFENNRACESNRPNMKIYESSSNPEVFCAFCIESSLDDYKLFKLGPFYGPVKKGNNKFYFHELCAIWSPDIFLDDNGKLKNVHKEIKRSKKLYCAYCGLRGAGLGCSNNSCKKNYHFLCAKSVGCFLNDQKYIMYCAEHKNSIRKEDIDSFFTREEEASDYSDLVCWVCKSGLDEDKILICDKCERCIHSYCHEPEIVILPKKEQEFLCDICEKNHYNK